MLGVSLGQLSKRPEVGGIVHVQNQKSFSFMSNIGFSQLNSTLPLSICVCISLCVFVSVCVYVCSWLKDTVRTTKTAPGHACLSATSSSPWKRVRSTLRRPCKSTGLELSCLIPINTGGEEASFHVSVPVDRCGVLCLWPIGLMWCFMPVTMSFNPCFVMGININVCFSISL